MRYSAHANERMQSRNFPKSVVEAIVSYGVSNFVRGAVSVMLDRQAICLVAESDKRLAMELERYRGTYAVIGDEGQIITVARRHRRLKK